MVCYHGGASDVDLWLTTPIKRVSRLLACIQEDAKEMEKASKGSKKPGKATIEMMEAEMMKRRKK